jgi:hypothetical protein
MHFMSTLESTKFNTLVLNLVVKETVPLLFIYFDLPLLCIDFIQLCGIRGRLLRYFIDFYLPLSYCIVKTTQLVHLRQLNLDIAVAPMLGTVFFPGY